MQQRVWAIPPADLSHSLVVYLFCPSLQTSIELELRAILQVEPHSRLQKTRWPFSVIRLPSRRPCNLSPSPLSESNQPCQSLSITPPDHKVSRYYPPNLNSSPWRCIERSSLLVLSAEIHSGVVVSDRGGIGPFQASCSKDSDLDCCNYLDHFGVRFLACPFALL